MLFSHELLAGGIAIRPFFSPTVRVKTRDRQARGKSVKMNQSNSANVIRRVLIASISGTLPDEFRDEAIVLLTEALNAPDDDVRGLAVIALNEIAGGSPDILPALTDALHDSCETVRKRAARAMGELGPHALPSLPHLTACLQDESKAVRLECVSSLGRIGPDAEASLPNLFVMLLEGDVRTRTVVSTAIRKIGSGAVSYSLAMLSDSDPLMRERACEMLGQLCCSDDSVVEALLEACTDGNAVVRTAARAALDRLQQECRI